MHSKYYKLKNNTDNTFINTCIHEKKLSSYSQAIQNNVK